MTEKCWLLEAVILAIHDEQIAEHGGEEGLRDLGLLQSAIARPQQLSSYGDNPSIVEMAAAYIIGIIKNHPFVDGNKRTGFISGILFLELNGLRFIASEEEAAAVILAVAAGQIDEAGLIAFLLENTQSTDS
jgi:death on curing protein